MSAAREPILNDLAMAGLGRSGAIEPALSAAYAPILAEEMRTRAAMVPQLLGLGQTLRGGEISGANLQSQIGERLRQGDVQGAMMLANLGETETGRESKLLGEAATSEEAVRQLEAQQFEAAIQDVLRRQAIALSLTTGVLGGFPAISGSTTRTSTSGGQSGMFGK
jgi:hypothetical protein